MRLVSAVSHAGSHVNEDAWGTVGNNEDVEAAWVLDGVTGINERNYLPGKTDAAWLVERVNTHLFRLAAEKLSLNEILANLVDLLIEDWRLASAQFDFPSDYDPPATCLLLVKRYQNNWNVVRLGDCSFIVRKNDGTIDSLAALQHDLISDALAERAKQLRATGTVEIKSLLAEFQPQLLAQRKTRNTASGLSVLNADIAALKFAEYRQFENVDQFLLCTDGFYRAVDCYDLYSDASLMAAAMKDVERVLRNIRSVEADDKNCQRFIRLKAADDATAVALSI